jgi:hypothetical protein
MAARFCLCTFVVWLSACATGAPRSLTCTTLYGGEAKSVPIAPAPDPYAVTPQQLGERFAWRAVYVTSPEDEATLNIYTYALTEEHPVLIHEAKYHPPYPHGEDGPHGFTGLQSVYEPRNGAELQYWCAWGTP